jgi:hypothetical protein
MQHERLNQKLISILSVEDLMEQTVSRIRDVGDDMVPDLIRIMNRRDLAMGKGTDKACVPCNAAEVLGRLDAEEVIESMLRLLDICDEDDCLYDSLKFALLDIGDRLIEPAIRFYQTTSRTSSHMAIAESLALLGNKSPEVLSIILNAFRNNPDFNCSLFAEYGDPSVIPELSAALDKCKLAGSVSEKRISDLAFSITHLGGRLSDSQVRIVNEARCGKAPTFGDMYSSFTEPSLN